MPKRNRFFRIGLSIVTVFAVLAVCGLTYHMVRVRLCDRILTKIDRLALHPPSNMSELEWAVHVYWTHNLHCNSMPLIHASHGSLRDLDQYLDDTFTTGPDRSTIDEIWTRYGQMTASGAAYQERYESEKDAIADAVSNQGTNYPYANDYQEFVQYERSRFVGAMGRN